MYGFFINIKSCHFIYCHTQELHRLATFSPPNYLYSWSGQLVVEKKKLEQVCNIKTISVCTGSLQSLKNILPFANALEAFAYNTANLTFHNQPSVACLVIPYITFSDNIRLCRMCVCHTPAGSNDRETGFYSETVVAIAQVVLKPNTSCAGKLKSQACAEGLVYSPTWLCGYSEELQACFDDSKVLPELAPVLQQLELDTTVEVKKKLCESLRILQEFDLKKVSSSFWTRYIELSSLCLCI